VGGAKKLRGYPGSGGIIPANYCGKESCVIWARDWRNSLTFKRFRPFTPGFPDSL